jgi:hypothetical protein
MIREKIRAMVEEADGDRALVIARFFTWFRAEDVVVFLEEMKPYITDEPPQLLNAVAHEIVRIVGISSDDAERRHRAVGERLDARENPILASLLKAEMTGAVGRALLKIVTDEIARYRLEHPQ